MPNLEQKKEEQPIQPIETNRHEELLERLTDFYLLNKNLIIGISAAVIVLAGILFFTLRQSQSSEQEASIAVSQIESLIAKGNIQAALEGDGPAKGLRDIISEYGGTASGNRARLLAGEIFLSLDEVDSAMSYYKGFSGSNPDLSATAKAGTAYCHQEKGELTEAAAAYEKAAETASNPALASSYLADAADTYLAMGKTDTAVALYKKIIRNYPEYASAAKARESLLSLAGKIGNTGI